MKLLVAVATFDTAVIAVLLWMAWGDRKKKPEHPLEGDDMYVIFSPNSGMIRLPNESWAEAMNRRFIEGDDT